MQPRVSIIVPNRDSPLVGETLAALAAQGAPGPGVEVLVVGSDRPGLVRSQGGVQRIESAEPLNPAAARNRGVAAARGDKLLFTDADCLPQTGWIGRLGAALDAAPVAGGAVIFNRNAGRWALADNIASFAALLPDRPAEPDSRGPLGSLNLAVRREAWDQVGPFDEELTTSEDFDWVERARRAGLATAFEPAAVVRHADARASRRQLVEHAAWYASSFHLFRRRYPGLLDSGPTWASRRRLAATAPLKALAGALATFLAHRRLWGCWRALPGVVLFKLTWYRTVVASWPEEPR